MQLRSHGVPESELDQPWIHVEPRREVEVVFNLTERYRNKDFPWKAAVDAYSKSSCGFVGSKREHALFEMQFGKMRHLETKTLMDVARVIRGSKLFIGNQSCPIRPFVNTAELESTECTARSSVLERLGKMWSYQIYERDSGMQAHHGGVLPRQRLRRWIRRRSSCSLGDPG